MKKVIVSTLAAAALALAATSCVTTEPTMVTSNTIGSKVGEVTTMYLCGTLPLPFDQGANGGTAAAAKAGGITKVATVDTKTYNLLNLIVKKTIVVTGE
ncbi:MAG: TRL-like family protein [Treponema sp.]|nr:TRL-like family protein [Treponema sp.]